VAKSYAPIPDEYYSKLRDRRSDRISECVGRPRKLKEECNKGLFTSVNSIADYFADDACWATPFLLIWQKHTRFLNSLLPNQQPFPTSTFEFRIHLIIFKLLKFALHKIFALRHYSRCTGPNNVLGAGGCSYCSKSIYSPLLNQSECLSVEQSCPEGYYRVIHNKLLHRTSQVRFLRIVYGERLRPNISF